MATKSFIHFIPVKAGSEIHNMREKELDYIIKDLTCNNEHWVDPRYEGKSQKEIRSNIEKLYETNVGQKMQAKAAPIREAIITIKPETTMDDLRMLAKQLEREFGIKCIQIHIHRDEGYQKAGDKDAKLNLHAHFMADWTDDKGKSLRLNRFDTSRMQTICAECLKMERGASSDVKHLNAIQYKEKKALESIAELRSLIYKSFLSKNAKAALYAKVDKLLDDLRADPQNMLLYQEIDQLNAKVQQLKADIEQRKQQHARDQQAISALWEEKELLCKQNARSETDKQQMKKDLDALREENRSLRRKAYPERYILPSFIDVDSAHIYKDKQGVCHIAMKFTGGSKEFDEKMSNKDFVAFKKGDLTKEEVIAKYHKPRIEGYIHREFSRPNKRSAALSLIESTIFSYMKLYASSAYVPSSNGDNNNRKRRNYDDIDDMNDEERKGMSYR